jgi:hypothetical protein
MDSGSSTYWVLKVAVPRMSGGRTLCSGGLVVADSGFVIEWLVSAMVATFFWF